MGSGGSAGVALLPHHSSSNANSGGRDGPCRWIHFTLPAGKKKGFPPTPPPDPAHHSPAKEEPMYSQLRVYHSPPKFPFAIAFYERLYFSSVLRASLWF